MLSSMSLSVFSVASECLPVSPVSPHSTASNVFASIDYTQAMKIFYISLFKVMCICSHADKHSHPYISVHTHIYCVYDFQFNIYIYVFKTLNERQLQKHFNPIKYIQCPEFFTTPVVFISGMTSTEVNKGTLLSEVRVATVLKCKSDIKGVLVEGEVYHLWKYM